MLGAYSIIGMTTHIPFYNGATKHESGRQMQSPFRYSQNKDWRLEANALLQYGLLSWQLFSVSILRLIRVAEFSLFFIPAAIVRFLSKEKSCFSFTEIAEN